VDPADRFADGAALFQALSDPRWTFDVELLWRARLAGISIASVPIRWTHREGTKLRPWDPILMLGRLVRLRLTG
jgi:dolichyl-phosphate beta-glucosyltransferase